MPKIFLPLFLVAVMAFAGKPARCQNFPMLHYTVEEGLPSNVVYIIYRDSKGFLWIGTDKGVARYNGIKFEIFTTYDGLPDNEIFLFQEDALGRLWLGTYNGELCYYKDGTFHNAVNTPFLKMSTRHSFITHVMPENDSSVTVRFHYNENYVNIKNETVRHIDLTRLKDKVNMAAVHVIKKVSGSTYQVFQVNKVITFDTAYNIKHVSTINDLPTNTWRLLGNQNRYFNFFGRYVADTAMRILKTFKNDQLDNRLIHQIYTNASKDWFICTDMGIIINDTISILNNHHASSITEDNEGNYWASTLDNGIFQISKDFINTKAYKHVYTAQALYAQSYRNQTFFTNTDNKIYLLENGKTTTLLDYNKYFPHGKPYQARPQFYTDSNFHFYSWSRNGYIEIEDLTARPFKVHCYQNNIHSTEAVKSLTRLGDELYINTRRRLLQIDLNSFRKGGIAPHTTISDTVNTNRVFSMTKGPENSIWYSTIESVFKVTGRVRKQQDQFSKIAFKYFSFYEHLLIGYTHDNILLICDNIDTKIRIDTIPAQNCIWDAFYRLDQNHLLISTNNRYRILNINAAHGRDKYAISTIENPYIPLQAEAICTDSANCYFFKNGAITAINLNSLFVKPSPPTLFFTFLKTGKNSYPVNSDLQLSYREAKNISISFATLSFANKDVQYQYSFSNSEQDNWRDVAGEEINLVNPWYGTYLLKIRAKTISSAYCAPITLSLTIHKPYWATWWFLLLCAAAMVLGARIAFRYRILHALHKKEVLHKNEIKFLKSEYKALNALMNPHFIFNTLNNVQSLINKNEKLAANQYLRIFADLVRQNMHNISQELIPLQNEIDIVSNYLKLEKLRFKDRLNYEIKIDEHVELSEIMIPPLLIQPLVENSIKHGILPGKSTESMVSIEVTERQGILVISVKDNGIGIAAAQKNADSAHESFGLENIKKRIAQLAIIQNKQITLEITDILDDAGKPQGTIVSISIGVG